MAYSHRLALLAALGVFLLIAPRSHAQDPDVRVKDLRVQKVGDASYFHLTLRVPLSLRQPEVLDANKQWSMTPTALRFRLARLPRLLPVDGKPRTTFYRIPESMFFVDHLRTLEFIGRAPAADSAQFLLQFPTEENLIRTDYLAQPLEKNTWAEARVKLEFGSAKILAPCKTQRSRESGARLALVRDGAV